MKAPFIPWGTIATLVATVAVGVTVHIAGDSASGAQADADTLLDVLPNPRVHRYEVTRLLRISRGDGGGHLLDDSVQGGVVVTGDLEIKSDNRPSRVYQPGEIFITMQDRPNILRNAGATEVHALLALIVDPDKPAAVPMR
jgi:hypothetical protein